MLLVEGAVLGVALVASPTGLLAVGPPAETEGAGAASSTAAPGRPAQPAVPSSSATATAARRRGRPVIRLSSRPLLVVPEASGVTG